MQDSFYRNFLKPEEKIVAFIGGGGKSTLIRRLSRDCQSLGKKVVILSLFPYIAPYEVNVLISSDLPQIDKQAGKELKKNSVLHLGKKYKNARIENFTLDELKKIIHSLTADHIFIEADSANGCSLSIYKKVPVSLLSEINRCINMIGADALNQVKNKHWLAAEDAFWRSKRILLPMDIASWWTSTALFERISGLKLAETYFINKVENIYIENLAIPLAKSVKMAGTDQVITGSVFNSNLHLIK
jgi:hypothetical protein